MFLGCMAPDFFPIRILSGSFISIYYNFIFKRNLPRYQGKFSNILTNFVSYTVIYAKYLKYLVLFCSYRDPANTSLAYWGPPDISNCSSK